MGPQSSRSRSPVPPARRRRPAATVRLRCEPFEDRVTPALFTAHAPAYTFSGLNNNGCVAVGDLNHDGYMDAVLTNEGTDFSAGADNTITVLYGRSTGGFTKVAVNTGGTNVSFVTLADINGDGYLDAVVTNENNAGNNSGNLGSFSVFKNDTHGNLILQTTYSTFSVNADCVRLADVTGDGVLDVIVSAFGPLDAAGDNVNGKITIFQGNPGANGHGDLTFNSSPITTIFPDVTFIPTAIAVADFDGDGNMDIAAAVPTNPSDHGLTPPDGNVYIYKGNGTGGFTSVAQYDSGGINPVNIQAADLDGDHLPELIIANSGDASTLTPYPDNQPLWYNDSIGVLANLSSSGNPAFGVTNIISANVDGPFAVAVADFNMDGKQDIAAVNYAGSSVANSFVSVYTGDGTGNFSTAPGEIDCAMNSPGGQYLDVGDFDKNGTPDLIIASASNQVGLMTNNTAVAARPTVSGVQVNDGTNQRSEVRSVQVTFSGPVTFTGGNANAAAAFQLTRLQDSTNVGLSAAVSLNGSNQTVVTLTFSGTDTDSVSALNGGIRSLIDGRYQLTILSANVSGSGGALNGGGANGNYVSGTDTFGGTGPHLYRLFGDVSGDGVVDATDLGQFRSAFNSNSSQANYLSYLDADNSGAIDASDLSQFRSRFNVNVFA
jgi:hypothetical protein